MRFSVAIAPLLASALVAAKPDNSALVIKDIATISTALTTLNDTLNTFQTNGVLNVLTAETIQNETSALETDLKKAASDTVASKDFGDAEDVAFAALDLVTPVQSVLHNLVLHKPAFSSAVLLVGSLDKTVYESLLTQRNLTKVLGGDLERKLGSTYGPLAPSVTQQLVQYFNQAIRAFETCTGDVCLPPV